LAFVLAVGRPVLLRLLASARLLVAALIAPSLFFLRTFVFPFFNCRLVSMFYWSFMVSLSFVGPFGR